MGDVNVSQLTPQVFEKLRNKMAETMCPVTLKNHIAHVRSIFRYAQDQKLIAGPISFGQRFKKPTQKTLRKHRLDRPKKMFTADQIKMMVADAPVHLKAMILLGINCGFGNTDCATVSIDALGLDTRWFDFARQKTAVERWGPLWDETVAALRDSLAQRPTPASDEYKRLFFLRDDGQPWILCKNDYVTLRFRNLLKRLNVYQEFVGFYSLRHTFFTKAEDYGDPKGAHFIMGHLSKSDDMAPVYREEFSDERLRRITDYVHDWIWGK
jgi:integrase